ncbi:uncharacterized protein LOC121372701 [Gigantopelta aegis]|uniref:uncharacterized protein LOC121372701 n=1 Tax=Gigantopelta aegis TaxID=1735272 RepID=UPI001B8885E5|nr:uncharacterized protein LOC121372701 [Gigantopelta aegis]
MTTMDEKVAMFDMLKSRFSDQLKNSNSENCTDLSDQDEVDVESNANDNMMSKAHKDVLQDSLTVLVDNMVPDDLFNLFISRDILTSMDVRRIRAGSTWEAVNTELISHIMRKSDFAFTAFVESLRLSCQGHLADLLEHSSVREEQQKRPGVEDVMSAKKKQLINKQRPHLVSDMTPDEIYNDLISQKVLTLTEVSRIKEKWREAANEALLDYIVRRSDRAFGVFVDSLRKTQQEHLSKLLELPTDSSTSEPVVKKLKVKEDEKEVSCEADAEPQDAHVCTLEDVQNQIVLMAESAFGNIRRKDDTQESFDQFCSEMAQTTTSINNSLELVHALRTFCEQSPVNEDEDSSASSTADKLASARLANT